MKYSALAGKVLRTLALVYTAAVTIPGSTLPGSSRTVEACWGTACILNTEDFTFYCGPTEGGALACWIDSYGYCYTAVPCVD